MRKFEMTLSHAVAKGTRRDVLVALRKLLADALEDERTQPRDLSPLVLRLKELAAEIEAIDYAEVYGTTVVEDGTFDPNAV